MIMTEQKKWALIRIIGFIVMCLGIVILGIATQGASIIIELIGLSGLFIGLCMIVHGLIKSWLHKEG
jgi:hypothetical protein